MASMGEVNCERMPLYDIIEYDPLLDSADMAPCDWANMARDIETHCTPFGCAACLARVVATSRSLFVASQQ
jgi:hypothetical protein